MTPQETPNPQTLHALVIDDHPVTHLGCRSLLAELGFGKIGKAEECGAALRYLDTSPPDLVLLDLGLPGVGGLELLPKLFDRAPDTRALIFTMNESPAFAAMALECGAHGFLSKNTPPEGFLTAVRTVMNGSSYLAPELALAVATKSARRSKGLSNLTPRELQVLRLIGRGLTYDEISGEINVSYKTVANVSSTIRRKLSARSLSDLIRIGLEVD